jgi:secondary thiamine-phosphate synthase enzyme
MALSTLHVRTTARQALVDITAQVQEAVQASGVQQGLCVVYVPHTTAGVLVNENADPDVAADILDALDRLVPLRAAYRHSEGNSAAHVKACLVGTSQTIIVAGGRLLLGTWQGIYLAEFDGPRERKVAVSVLPETSKVSETSEV